MACRERGVTSTVATVLLVAIVVVVSASVLTVTTGIADDLGRGSLASVSVEREAIDFSDYGVSGECPGTDVELVVEVTLDALQRADRIYVIATSEGDEALRTLWDDPGPDDVGETIVVGNEVTSGTPVDVDVGGRGDVAYCPGESATFGIYAETDGQTTILQRFEF